MSFLGNFAGSFFGQWFGYAGGIPEVIWYVDTEFSFTRSIPLLSLFMQQMLELPEFTVLRETDVEVVAIHNAPDAEFKIISLPQVAEFGPTKSLEYAFGLWGTTTSYLPIVYGGDYHFSPLIERTEGVCTYGVNVLFGKIDSDNMEFNHVQL